SPWRLPDRSSYSIECSDRPAPYEILADGQGFRAPASGSEIAPCLKTLTHHKSQSTADFGPGPGRRGALRKGAPREVARFVLRECIFGDEPAEPAVIDCADEGCHGAVKVRPRCVARRAQSGRAESRTSC